MKRLSDYKCNPANPREIKKSDFEKLTKSLAEFKKMLALRPIVHDENNVILGGNMRFQALQELGYKDVPDEWFKCADDLTEQEKHRFIIADNGAFGTWDFDALANDGWADLPLTDWGVPIPEEWGDVQEPDAEPTGPDVVKCPECGHEFDRRSGE